MKRRSNDASLAIIGGCDAADARLVTSDAPTILPLRTDLKAFGGTKGSPLTPLPRLEVPRADLTRHSHLILGDAMRRRTRVNLMVGYIEDYWMQMARKRWEPGKSTGCVNRVQV
jgi:hypothetical protein